MPGRLARIKQPQRCPQEEPSMIPFDRRDLSVADPAFPSGRPATPAGGKRYAPPGLKPLGSMSRSTLKSGGRVDNSRQHRTKR